MAPDDIVPVFLAACPGLATAWAEYLREWESDSERGVYNDVSIISDFIVGRYSAGDLSELPAAFAALERCLVEGDEEGRTVATIGIIEGIQILASHHPFGPGVFESWLAPRSRLAWVIGEASWSGEFALADYLRARLGGLDPWAVELNVNQIQSESVRLTINRLKPAPNSVTIPTTGSSIG